MFKQDKESENSKTKDVLIDVLKVLVMFLVVGIVIWILSKASFLKEYRKEGVAKEEYTELQIRRKEEVKRQLEVEKSKYDDLVEELAKLKEEDKVKEIERELVKKGDYRVYLEGVRYFGLEEDEEAIKDFAKFWDERGVNTVGAWRGKALKEEDETGYSIILYMK